MSETFIVALILILVGLLLISIPIVVLTDVSIKAAFKFWIWFIFLLNILIVLTYFIAALIGVIHIDTWLFPDLDDFFYKVRWLLRGSLMHEMITMISHNSQFIISNLNIILFAATIGVLIVTLILAVMIIAAVITTVVIVCVERPFQSTFAIIIKTIFHLLIMIIPSFLIAWVISFLVDIDLLASFGLVYTIQVLCLLHRKYSFKTYSAYIKCLNFTIFSCTSIAFIVTFIWYPEQNTGLSFWALWVMITLMLLLAYLATTFSIQLFTHCCIYLNAIYQKAKHRKAQYQAIANAKQDQKMAESVERERRIAAAKIEKEQRDILAKSKQQKRKEEHEIKTTANRIKQEIKDAERKLNQERKASERAIREMERKKRAAEREKIAAEENRLKAIRDAEIRAELNKQIAKAREEEEKLLATAKEEQAKRDAELKAELERRAAEKRKYSKYKRNTFHNMAADAKYILNTMKRSVKNSMQDMRHSIKQTHLYEEMSDFFNNR